jgi:sugar (pentulose or hexulose) kinase
MSRLYLGIDVGTSATRVSLIADDGLTVASASAAYPTLQDGSGSVEQDPHAWSEALGAALRQAGIGSHAPAAIGLCGQNTCARCASRCPTCGPSSPAA